MADTKISALANGSTVQVTDNIPVERGGNNFRVQVGSAATQASSTFATAAQGALADSALQNIVEDTTPQLGGNLGAQGNNITDLGDVTFKAGAVGGTLRTGTSAADKFTLQAYDTNGSSYVTLMEADAGTEPFMQIFVDYFRFEDATDATKIAKLDVSGITTGATRTYSFPDATGTFALTSDLQNTFSTIAVSGQSNVVADTTSDTLTFVAGDEISITTSAAGDSVTINATTPKFISRVPVTATGTDAVPAGATTAYVKVAGAGGGGGAGVDHTVSASTAGGQSKIAYDSVDRAIANGGAAGNTGNTTAVAPAHGTASAGDLNIAGQGSAGGLGGSHLATTRYGTAGGNGGYSEAEFAVTPSTSISITIGAGGAGGQGTGGTSNGAAGAAGWAVIEYWG